MQGSAAARAPSPGAGSQVDPQQQPPSRPGRWLQRLAASSQTGLPTRPQTDAPDPREASLQRALQGAACARQAPRGKHRTQKFHDCTKAGNRAPAPAINSPVQAHHAWRIVGILCAGFAGRDHMRCWAWVIASAEHMVESGAGNRTLLAGFRGPTLLSGSSMKAAGGRQGIFCGVRSSSSGGGRGAQMN